MSTPPSLLDFGADSDEQQPPRPARRRRPAVLTVLGLLLLCGGLGCLGWVGYQLFGTNIVSQKAFDQQTTQLRDRWQDTAPSTGGNAGSSDKSRGSDTSTDTSGGTDRAESIQVPGTAIALLRIPKFGADYEVPIVQGIDPADLTRGVGHYPSSADPGQVGNFAIAGHRITHGQPFARLLELNAGDTVIVETRDEIYTHRLDSSPRALTVNEDAGWVLQPVPGRPDATATKKLITLTTCQDLFHSPDRSIAFGTLVQTEQK